MTIPRSPHRFQIIDFHIICSACCAPAIRATFWAHLKFTFHWTHLNGKLTHAKYVLFQVPRPSGKIWGWPQTRPQHWSNRPLLQLSQKVIREERRGGGGQCQEEGLQLVRCLLLGWGYDPHRDDVHQPKSHRWEVTPDTDQNRKTLLLNLCFPLHWALRKRYWEK